MTDTAARLDALLAHSAALEETSVAAGGAELFVPELVLGRGRLHPDDEAAIVEHLVAVSRARRVPLHPTVAWNCLYFGYDTSRPGYDTDALGPMVLPTLVPGTTSDALPVGALVEYSSGTAADHREWAEVVFKEGRPPNALDAEGLVRPEYSGAPGIVGLAPGDEQVTTELLVLDFEPLGPLHERAKRWLERSREDEDRSYIDELGHVSIEARYADQDAAAMSDAEYFCAWMLDKHHELLAQGWLGAALDDPDDATLAEALANSLDAVQDVLERSGSFSEWNGYWYLKDEYDAAADPELPGGQADASRFVTSLGRVPRGEHIVYRPFSPLLQEVVGRQYLCYGDYARYAVMTGARVAEVLAERAPDGICTIQGENVVLRLDDAWLFSGVWRAERLVEGMACSLVGYPATVTLGLGSTGEAGHEDVVLPAAAEDEAPAGVSEAVGDLVFWTTSLRESHRTEQRMAVDPRASLVPGADGSIVLRLAHQGDIADDERVQRVGISADGAWISPVRFPFDFFTGIRLHCLARPGGSVVRASTEFLPGGEEMAGVPYYFAFDRSLLDPQHPPEGRPSLGRIALSALIRHGEELRAGWRRLSSAAIAELVFGPDLDDETVASVAAALEAGGRAHLEDGYWYYRTSGPGKGVPPTTATSGVFAGASEALADSVERAAIRHRREHRVVLHLRRLWVSEEASPERQAEYLYWRERAPNRANLPPGLPAGYTFVASHKRGQGGH